MHSVAYISHRMNARTILIIALVFALWATPVLAQQPQENLPTSLEGLIVSLYNGAVRIVGLAAFLMILYAGILRLVGRGRESNQVILDAIVGTILLLSAVVILNSINPDLTQQGEIFRNTDATRNNAQTGGGAILPIVVQ